MMEMALLRLARRMVRPRFTRKSTAPRAMKRGHGMGDSVKGLPRLWRRNQKLTMVPSPAVTRIPSWARARRTLKISDSVSSGTR